MNSKNKLLFYLIIVIIFIILFILYYFKLYNYDSFLISNLQDNPEFDSLERTKLYGSLFLDNLNSVITNMTDPPIKYDTKRIDIIKYNDILV